ncbi:unnamed protein product [Kuraishia capsulata CBS 1993]|uniref:Major facilitator superfamily (MFS) profile domain-containing protein n=1 Tax=Kuraishia capsulata CBS 1993 TaxID=1382522 RepID=W6MVP4_9ASCO|nr:uncharacterized protein KUCA_T00006032001 [Kuraishia capsulata CBS 1993]CDK30037.1 unnamed protein product [Kuraishia capsulata CBS 1993]
MVHSPSTSIAPANLSDREIMTEGVAEKDTESSAPDILGGDEFYDRFSSSRKNSLVAIVALACFLSPCTSMAYLPAIDEISQTFHTTRNIINISNGVYCVVMAISPCIMSPMGDVYGRRMTFLLCTVGFTVSTVLVAVSQNLAMFFVFRCCCALFGTAFFSVGGNVVGDIYLPHQRGNAMGWILSGSQVGSAFSPVIGGIIMTYTHWRVIFWVLVGLGAVTFAVSLFFLPETARTTVAKEIRKEHPGKRLIFVPYNPLRVVLALRYPNLLLIGIVSMSLVYNMYTLLTPIRAVIDPRFHLTTPVYGALFYLAPGMGYFLGTFAGGRWADRYVKKYAKIRGVRIPEDRLRSTYFAYGFVIPAGMLVYGWSLEKEKGGMALPIIALFFSGFSQTIVFPSVNAYCVDSLPELKGDAVASNYFIRYIGGGVGTATCVYQIDSIGIGWSSTISAFVLWGGFAACCVLIRYGEKLKKPMF